MEEVNDNLEVPENLIEENIEIEEPLDADLGAQKLVDGISIKDVYEGKEVLFEISPDNEKDYSEYGDEDEVMLHVPKSIREKQGAPPLDKSFDEIVEGMTNVTEDGFVKKEIITSGSGPPVPKLAYVTVHYNLYKKSSELPFDSTYLRDRPARYRLDQGELILGLEQAIKSMKKNENSRFYIKWEVAFGPLGCPERIEKKCDIVADVTLLNFVEMDPETDLTNDEVRKIDFNKYIKEVKLLFCKGRDEFVKGETSAAVYRYRKGLRILNNLRLANKEEEMELLRQKVRCLVNLAACYNKLGRPEQACVACQEALSIDYFNLKANFQYARANIALSNFPTAERYLARANSIKPGDDEINKEIKKLNDKKALYTLSDKMFWKKAFENEESKKEEDTSILESFEKSLKTSLEECVKEDKPHVVSLPLKQTEMEICEKVAKEMNMELERHAHFCIIKPSFKNSEN